MLTTASPVPSPQANALSTPAAEAVKPNPFRALIAYERAVYGQTPAVATELLIDLLNSLHSYTSNEGLFKSGTPLSLVVSMYTRMAAAITTHICSPGWSVTPSQFYRICALKWTAENVFRLSGFHNANHLLEWYATSSNGGTLQLNQRTVFFLSLFFSLDDIPDEIMQVVLGLPAEQLLPLALGWIAAHSVLTPDGERRRGELMAARSRYESAPLPGELILPLAHAWMFCSYASHPDKHEFKRSLNRLWRSLLSAERVQAKSIERNANKARPTLVVAAERMRPGHAMHRSYAHSLRQLRNRFHVVLLVREADYENGTADMFDSVSTMPVKSSLRDIAASVIRLKPDVLLYPSLGMSDWTVAMANLRLAPIQVMLLGHPAPMMADTVDYAFIQACHEAAAADYGVKAIMRSGDGVFDAHYNLPAERPPKRKHTDDCLHVAVNSSLMKLSPRFLSVCVRLQNECSKRLHFHFFASATGIRFDDLRSRFSALFPRMSLHAPMEYRDFLEELAQCDLALSAFPFGNTNSTVDTCVLGIPVVAFYANEVLSMGDRDITQAAGLPKWLLTETDEDYFQAAKRLIEEDTEREAIATQLRETDVRARLFVPARPEDATEFVDGMWWIYKHHEELQRSQGHTFKVGEVISA